MQKQLLVAKLKKKTKVNYNIEIELKPRCIV